MIETLELLWLLGWGVSMLFVVGVATSVLGTHVLANRMAPWGVALPQAAALGAAATFWWLDADAAAARTPTATWLVWVGAVVVQILAILPAQSRSAVRFLGHGGLACAVLAVSTAGGVVLLADSPAGLDSFERLLTGQALLAGPERVLRTSLLLVPGLLFVVWFRRPLALATVAPDEARSLGLRPGVWRIGLALALVSVVAAGVEATGTTFVLATLTFGGATGLYLGRSPGRIQLVAGAAGAAAALLGCLVAASPADLPAGPTCGLVAGLVLPLAVAIRTLARRSIH